ncbi:hypothetical protein PanWU01x14_208490 [Parasponia andersonii]|uniref:Uncharacterized protein n=1 Tax=Parasponia andersonii TaxID=3476 RepID=A0A2P5BUI9_PARAD|nr:hypothetical protein PanWU01x14_208490 [Parasponia andersonii]
MIRKHIKTKLATVKREVIAKNQRCPQRKKKKKFTIFRFFKSKEEFFLKGENYIYLQHKKRCPRTQCQKLKLPKRHSLFEINEKTFLVNLNAEKELIMGKEGSFWYKFRRNRPVGYFEAHGHS